MQDADDRVAGGVGHSGAEKGEVLHGALGVDRVAEVEVDAGSDRIGALEPARDAFVRDVAGMVDGVGVVACAARASDRRPSPHPERRAHDCR